MNLLRLSHLRQRFSPHGPPQSSTDEFDDDDPNDDSNDRPITRLDVLANIHLLEPRMRLTDEELQDVAWRAGYPLPLHKFPHFPPPEPQDSFYYHLIMDPSALLWYLKLYGDTTGDYRHSHITCSCNHLIPKEYPDGNPLPRFRDKSQPETPLPIPQNLKPHATIKSP